MITIYYSSEFKKSIQKYSSYRKQVIRRIELFRQNPHNPQLKSHTLQGELAGYWSFSVTYHLRILFEFIDKETVGFIDIGTHGIYKK